MNIKRNHPDYAVKWIRYGLTPHVKDEMNKNFSILINEPTQKFKLINALQNRSSLMTVAKLCAWELDYNKDLDIPVTIPEFVGDGLDQEKSNNEEFTLLVWSVWEQHYSKIKSLNKTEGTSSNNSRNGANKTINFRRLRTMLPGNAKPWRTLVISRCAGRIRKGTRCFSVLGQTQSPPWTVHRTLILHLPLQRRMVWVVMKRRDGGCWRRTKAAVLIRMSKVSHFSASREAFC